MSTDDNYHDLPVRSFRESILNAVDANQVTIITAETGAGKSTQIPQYLAEHGYTRVVVTQPRILAARNLTKRVREEWAERNNDDASIAVGYRTANERDDSGQTKVLYCTDGLQLVREITGSGTAERQVLVLDEVHEWNENMEVLVAWAKKRCEEEPSFKVVIMSATVETDSLAEYYGTTAVINVPGRHFDVKKRRGTDVISELFTFIDKPGHAILTFLPGKSEIQNVSDAIEKKAKEAGVEVLPLHSQMELEDQQKTFAYYPGGKIILATNIAQTSVTIEDIDIVIDSGLERRSEVKNGVEGLFISQISRADCLQRAGRAGRTKPGEYILAPYDTMPCLKLDEREEYPTPEIMRKHIDRLTLRLASVGIDIEVLDFYHDPSKKAIQRAKRTLVALGAMTRNGEVTGIGREMEKFPVESSYGRMLVEANKFSESVQSKLAAIIGIQEVGGIIKGGNKYTAWRGLTSQTKSDLLAEYEVYLALPTILEDTYEDTGIISRNVDKAREVIQRLHHDLGLEYNELEAIGMDEESLLMCIIAGQLHEIWLVDEFGGVEHIDTAQQRELSSSTVLKNPRLITGTPFDLQVPTRSGGLETLHLVQGATVAKIEWLVEAAPDEFVKRKGKLLYDPRLKSLAEQSQVIYGRRIIAGNNEAKLEDTRENHEAFTREYTKWVFDQLQKQIDQLRHFHKNVPKINQKQVESEVRNIATDIVSLDQLSSEDKRRMTALAKLETYLGEDYMRKLGKPRFGGGFKRPHRNQGDGPRRRFWKPKHKRH